jgi:PBP1b-binding outer membrane lipoprotein LpoB
MKRRIVLVLALALLLAGCVGAGPASTPGSARPRCGSRAADDQRPLFYVFCVESP